MSDDLVTIARFETGVEAHEARITLEDADIECLIADEVTANLALPGALGVGGIRLQVKAEDAEKATQILTDTPAANDLEFQADSEEPTNM